MKIENGPAARPQAGLEAADLVYEEPIEGGGAWLLALFQCSDPSLVGPIRAAHLADPAILAQHTPVILVHAGGSPAVLERMASVPGLEDLDALRLTSGFRRDPGRRAPHNLFASPQALRDAAGTRGPPAQLRFRPDRPDTPRVDDKPPTRRPGSSVMLSFGGEELRYVWSASERSYLRFQGSDPHTTASGRQLRATNVVILWVTARPGPLRDEAGNPSPELDLVGKGDALVLQGGVEREGRWERPRLSTPTRLLDREGKPIDLVSGTTWVHLLPKERPAYVR